MPANIPSIVHLVQPSQVKRSCNNHVCNILDSSHMQHAPRLAPQMNHPCGAFLVCNHPQGMLHHPMGDQKSYPLSNTMITAHDMSLYATLPLQVLLTKCCPVAHTHQEQQHVPRAHVLFQTHIGLEQRQRRRCKHGQPINHVRVCLCCTPSNSTAPVVCHKRGLLPA